MEQQMSFERIRHDYIRLADLRVHPKVQRSLKAPWVAKITASFDPDQFGELSVMESTFRGAKCYLVFDGQHRYTAALRALGSDQQKVPCAVYEDMTEEQLARMFLGHSNVVPVRPLDKWPIRLMAHDEAVTQVDRILTKRDLHVGNSRGVGTVQAVAALEQGFKRYGGKVLELSLDVIIAAWGRDPDAYDGSFIKALGLICNRFDGAVDYRDLAKKLAKAGGPARLLGQARDYAKVSAMSMERALADRIVNVYNKKRHANRIEWEARG
jgi:hypothetical protein